MIIPNLDQAKEKSKGYSVMPVAMQVLSDVKTSIQILKTIKSFSEEFFLLESVTASDNWGRYSFIGYNPTLKISGTDSIVTTIDNGKTSTTIQNPIKAIKELIHEYKSPKIEDLPPFTGGFVGYFAYDFVKYCEPSLKLNAKNPYKFDDFNLMLFDKVIAFDHFKQKIYLIVNIKTDNLEKNYIDAISQLKDMENKILNTKDDYKTVYPKISEFKPVFSDEEYKQKIKKAKEYIFEGDIFQVVPSNRQEATIDGDLFEVYRQLRTINPSPYMVYFKSNDLEIACASPETLVSLKDNIAHSYPLAGTTQRGKTDDEDKQLISTLLSDNKELSEHDMLVDLARNDIGKISEFGSVKVEEYRQIKKFSHVSHISSKVVGQVKKCYDAIDVLVATLPAGTLSGAPKKRACEIIDELEGLKRGVYGGAIGYIDFTGNMDMCIGIRLAIKKNSKVFVQSGGGIVFDSNEDNEILEIKNKAGAMINAIKNVKERN